MFRKMFLFAALVLFCGAAAHAQSCNSTGGNGVGGPWGSICEKTITLSTAQILALHTTGITAIPAPGAGLTIQPLACTSVLNYVGTFAAGALVTANAGPVANSLSFGTCIPLALVTDTANSEAINTLTTAITDVVANIQNQPITLNAGTTFTGGTGSTITLTLFYRVSRP